MREVPYSNVCFLKFSLASVWGIDMAEGGRSRGGEVCEEIHAMNGWWWAERGVIRPRNREAEYQQGVAVNWQQGVREEEERAPSVLSWGSTLTDMHGSTGSSITLWRLRWEVGCYPALLKANAALNV